jgi:hypothetical protein
MEMKQFRSSKSDLVQAEAAAVKVLVRSESIPETLPRCTSVLRFSRAQTTDNSSVVATIASEQTGRSWCRPRGPYWIERVKRRRQIAILDLVSIDDRSAASTCGAGLRAQKVNGHLTAAEFKALFSAEI